MADKGFSADADTTALVVDDNLVLKRLLGFCEGHQGEKVKQIAIHLDLKEKREMRKQIINEAEEYGCTRPTKRSSIEASKHY
ncbi:hypothetical protein NC653_031721 [Populus alba x Populus x berolinensis]|uniref:Uncharacterized protein n=1 Tax=Populus alba x Populus x berolinensis TaxID=444605 RepID=A0AAD6LZ47_9ROSI|nr:hypothetical protein NC653_031721 [Populus alba x Populus x berolinensis]